ncbi:Protein of unknown function DUF2344 [Coriobacterium glomerans PW2]|uniref:DUF2344 domain-containing protein n=1 Tax=Coriobacterium glomerans (strain ATCC 49209 / DSM 20642 / JCM 10262 / PW2) TaxID=700015 RepID=F2N7T1_CORGP|nr:TIGR03936 family radical SAM-associated protein [Coriobacterium glomerans]AEB06973.1 Protein of unknown function DUF2344 [Coriobacterium glomerans PW2]
MSDQLPFRLRVRYVKQGRLRYLGHPEVLRTIERSVRRAGLPYAVTQGLSPHMRIAFCSALPVGASSRCELYDLWLSERVRTDRALDALRHATPEGLAPVRAGYIDVRAAALTVSLTRIGYSVEVRPREGFSVDLAAWNRALTEIASAGQICYLRGAKRKRLDLDRTLACWRVSASETEGAVRIELETRAGSAGSLRPDIVLAAIDQSIGRAQGLDEPVDHLTAGPRAHMIIESCEIERTLQTGEDEHGILVPALPDPQSAGTRANGSLTASE